MWTFKTAWGRSGTRKHPDPTRYHSLGSTHTAYIFFVLFNTFLMRFLDFPWLSLTSFDFPWLPWLPWLSLTFLDFACLSLTFLDFPWLSVSFREVPWLSLTFLDFPWFSWLSLTFLDFLDFPWLSLTSQGHPDNSLDFILSGKSWQPLSTSLISFTSYCREMIPLQKHICRH